mgnify:CR=1 FL=1
MAAKELFNQPLTATPSEDDRIAVAAPGKVGSENMKFKYLKRESRNAPDEVTTSVLVPLPDGQGYRYTGEVPLSHISTEFNWTNPDTAQVETVTIKDGEVVEVVFDGAGKEISHNQAPIGDDLPIYLILGGNYVTSKVIEGFRFRLFTLSVGRVWVDISNQATLGSVAPDDFTAEKSAQQGYVVNTAESPLITGLSDAATAKAYGTATFVFDGTPDAIICTNAADGVVTGVEDSGKIYSFASGVLLSNPADSTFSGVGIAADGSKVYINGVKGLGTGDGAPYLEHSEGVVDCGSGIKILGDLIEEAV